VSVLHICVAYPLVPTLAGRAYIQAVTPGLTVLLLSCDSEDGYRRMGDDETVLYVAVPLQVV
jgi:hypothetical protein